MKENGRQGTGFANLEVHAVSSGPLLGYVVSVAQSLCRRSWRVLVGSLQPAQVVSWRPRRGFGALFRSGNFRLNRTFLASTGRDWVEVGTLMLIGLKIGASVIRAMWRISRKVRTIPLRPTVSNSTDDTLCSPAPSTPIFRV